MDSKGKTGEGELGATHRVEFLAHKDLIEARLQEGYAAKAIWKHLRDAEVISQSYSQFTRHVNKHTTWGQAQRAAKRQGSGSGKPANTAEAAPTVTSPGTAAQTGSKRAPIEPPKPFKWNPVPLSDEEIRTGNVTSR
jgi:hypothetical protein